MLAILIHNLTLRVHLLCQLKLKNSIQVEKQTFSVQQLAVFGTDLRLKDECVMCGHLGVVFTGLIPHSQLHHLLIGCNFLLALLLAINLETNYGKF